MAKVTGGELLVRTLKQAGVETMFGLHGAHLDTIFQACLDHRIAIVDTRHEAAAGHAAEGYSRAKKALGVAMATAGPGFTNIITSIANSYLDHTPVLYLGGSAPLAGAETNTLQGGVDQLAMVKPVTKWAHRIATTQHIPRLVAEAVRMATSAPSGPVYLDLPVDVLSALVDEDEAVATNTLKIDSPIAPAAQSVTRALEVLASAKRPVIMLGAQVWRAGSEAELLSFAETTQIPVYSDYAAHGLLPSRHRLYGGTYHKMAELGAENRPDVILALGVRFGLFTLGAGETLVPNDAKIIHVQVDPREIGLIKNVAVPVISCSRQFLIALGARLKDYRWPDRSAWVETVRAATDGRRQRLEKEAGKPTSPIHPFHAVSAIADALPDDAIVIGDGAECYHWFNEVVRQDRPGGYLTHGFLGIMGFGMGLAIGAKAAHPNRPVLCLAGDGAAGFGIAEFDTMARHDLPIVVVVMNNRSWGASFHFQEMTSGANRVTGTRLGDAKYHEVAAAFGCQGVEVRELKELGPAIKAAFKSGKPACIDVAVDLGPVAPELLMISM